MDSNIRKFWDQGKGSQLIQWTEADLKLHNTEQTSQRRSEYDTLGDDATKEILKNRNFNEAYALITRLSAAKISENDELPDSIKQLFMAMQEKPSWLNEELITAGCDLCMRSGTNALVSLRDYSLMSGYDYAYLNKALIFTGALKKGPSKRVTDTLDFWIQVTRHKALEINAPGYQYIARTRMMHSFSRLMILERYEDWDNEKWGKPINYWDMVATNIGFSLFYLHGLHQLGLRISEKEERGVFHLWKYIGHLLGIPEAYLPDNKKQATEIFYLWTTGQISADSDSVLLAQALENESIASNIFKKSYQKQFLKYLHTCYVHFLMDEETCNRLGISKVTMYYFFPWFRKLRNQFWQKLTDMSAKNYQRSVYVGDLLQRKISTEYLKADGTPHS